MNEIHIHKVCWKCGKQFQSSKEMFEHQKKEHDNKKFTAWLSYKQCKAAFQPCRPDHHTSTNEGKNEGLPGLTTSALQ